MSGNTVFISYILIPTSGLTDGNYSQAIHCNYFKKIDLGTTDPYIQEVSLNFPNSNYFKFLTTGGTSFPEGYMANKIHALVQIVSNSGFTTFNEVKPDSTLWKQLDITNQITVGYSGFLTPTNITSVVFKIPLLDYTGSTYSAYTLQYLNYPSSGQIDEMVFGDATYFFGNVATSIKADVYTTDISINLPLAEFNSTSNLTWDSNAVYISEIGLYAEIDNVKYLVAIGKLNDPVAKDESIARTIVFALDF